MLFLLAAAAIASPIHAQVRGAPASGALTPATPISLPMADLPVSNPAAFDPPAAMPEAPTLSLGANIDAPAPIAAPAVPALQALEAAPPLIARPAEASQADGTTAPELGVLERLGAEVADPPGGDAGGSLDRFFEHRDALDGLKTEGWAALPPSFLPAGLEESVRAHAEHAKAPDAQGYAPSVLLYHDPVSASFLHPLREFGIDDGPIEAFVRGVDRMLKAALPGEPLQMGQVAVRRNRGTTPQGSIPHVDNGVYLTFTVAFGEPEEGLGTVIYRKRKGGVEALRLPARVLAVITGDQREAETGVPATPHAATLNPMADPAVGTVVDRSLLIFRYYLDGAWIPREVQDRIAARVQAAVRHWQGAKAPRRGFWRRWLGLGRG